MPNLFEEGWGVIVDLARPSTRRETAREIRRGGGQMARDGADRAIEETTGSRATRIDSDLAKAYGENYTDFRNALIQNPRVIAGIASMTGARSSGNFVHDSNAAMDNLNDMIRESGGGTFLQNMNRVLFNENPPGSGQFVERPGASQFLRRLGTSGLADTIRNNTSGNPDPKALNDFLSDIADLADRDPHLYNRLNTLLADQDTVDLMKDIVAEPDLMAALQGAAGPNPTGNDIGNTIQLLQDLQATPNGIASVRSALYDSSGDLREGAVPLIEKLNSTGITAAFTGGAGSADPQQLADFMRELGEAADANPEFYNRVNALLDNQDAADLAKAFAENPALRNALAGLAPGDGDMDSLSGQMNTLLELAESNPEALATIRDLVLDDAGNVDPDIVTTLQSLSGSGIQELIFDDDGNMYPGVTDFVEAMAADEQIMKNIRTAMENGGGGADMEKLVAYIEAGIKGPPPNPNFFAEEAAKITDKDPNTVSEIHDMISALDEVQEIRDAGDYGKVLVAALEKDPELRKTFRELMYGDEGVPADATIEGDLNALIKVAEANPNFYEKVTKAIFITDENGEPMMNRHGGYTMREGAQEFLTNPHVRGAISEVFENGPGEEGGFDLMGAISERAQADPEYFVKINAALEQPHIVALLEGDSLEGASPEDMMKMMDAAVTDYEMASHPEYGEDYQHLREQLLDGDGPLASMLAAGGEGGPETLVEGLEKLQALQTKWDEVFPNSDTNIVSALADLSKQPGFDGLMEQFADNPAIIDAIMSNAGGDPETAVRFIQGLHERAMDDPSYLENMQKFAARYPNTIATMITQNSEDPDVNKILDMMDYANQFETMDTFLTDLGEAIGFDMSGIAEWLLEGPLGSILGKFVGFEIDARDRIQESASNPNGSDVVVAGDPSVIPTTAASALLGPGPHHDAATGKHNAYLDGVGNEDQQAARAAELAAQEQEDQMTRSNGVVPGMDGMGLA